MNSAMADLAVTRDAFFDGRLVVAQPERGHRSGTDAVLLAACAPTGFDGVGVDAGAGVGVVGLGLALACPGARVRLIERDPGVAQLAAENIIANGLDERLSVYCLDLLSCADRRRAVPEPANLVLTNPPFYATGRVRASPDSGRRAAHVLDAAASLEDWLVACLDCLAPNGTIIVIHAAEALPEMIAAFDRRAGGIIVKCVHPRLGAAARRVLVRATKGSRGPLSIAPPLVLHEGDAFTPEADALHRGRATIAWA